MDRGKALGSYVGVWLGILTIPVLGPFSALVGMAGAAATKALHDKLTEKSGGRERRAEETTNMSHLTFDEIMQKFNSSNHPIQTEQSGYYFQNMPQPDFINHRAVLTPGRQRSIHVDEYGFIYDPEDD